MEVELEKTENSKNATQVIFKQQRLKTRTKCVEIWEFRIKFIINVLRNEKLSQETDDSNAKEHFKLLITQKKVNGYLKFRKKRTSIKVWNKVLH